MLIHPQCEMDMEEQQQCWERNDRLGMVGTHRSTGHSWWIVEFASVVYTTTLLEGSNMDKFRITDSKRDTIIFIARFWKR